MIISASRRTDIPAFYHKWFFNRLAEGFVLTRNPFNAKQITRVSLLAEDVDVIVFWTRNPSKMLPNLMHLHNFNYYFQYTITSYPKILDAHGINPYQAISTFIELSKKIGRNKVIWRYDPILISNITPLSEHKRLFEKIAKNLAGYTDQVVISFADLYQKTERNLKQISGFTYRDITTSNDDIDELCSFLSNTAQQYDMRIATCAESFDLTQLGIQKGKCIDDTLIKSLFGLTVSSKKDSGQRETCGCIKSIDIGQYNTCLHGCNYCYATYNHKIAKQNNKKHNASSPFMLSYLDDFN